MEHFSGTLRDMKVDQSLIDDAMQVIMPLRKVFEQGRLDAEKKKTNEARWRLVVDKVALAAAVLVLAFFATRSLKNHKK
jgi:hypothetical protein